MYLIHFNICIHPSIYYTYVYYLTYLRIYVFYSEISIHSINKTKVLTKFYKLYVSPDIFDSLKELLVNLTQGAFLSLLSDTPPPPAASPQLSNYDNHNRDIVNSKEKNETTDFPTVLQSTQVSYLSLLLNLTKNAICKDVDLINCTLLLTKV
jgi:hypothetical protein